MPVLVSNNASTRLAAGIAPGDTQIPLQAGTGINFPIPGASDWFPLTLIRPDGSLEIMRATERTGDMITVERAQEGTPAMAFSAGDRVELRLTAGALLAMVNEVKLTFVPVQQGGGAGQSNNKLYLGWSGSGLKAQIDALDYGTLWSTYNFNPASYMPVAGGNFTGGIGIYNTSPTIMLYDTDWGPRQLHCNGGSIGFLTSGGGWACYSDNSGNFIATANIGAFSDRKHKTDIRTIEDGLELVERLRGVRYTRKRDGVACVGVIAQEVQEVVPEVILETDDGLGVDYGNLVGPLIEAVKQLSARVRRLEAV